VYAHEKKRGEGVDGELVYYVWCASLRWILSVSMHIILLIFSISIPQWRIWLRFILFLLLRLTTHIQHTQQNIHIHTHTHTHNTQHIHTYAPFTNTQPTGMGSHYHQLIGSFENLESIRHVHGGERERERDRDRYREREI